jgi:hypothetical protein
LLHRNHFATTAAAHRASKAGDHLSALLILLALRRHRSETQRNNARALIGRRELAADCRSQPLWG